MTGVKPNEQHCWSVSVNYILRHWLGPLSSHWLHVRKIVNNCARVFPVLSELSSSDGRALGALCYFPASCVISENDSFLHRFFPVRTALITPGTNTEARTLQRPSWWCLTHSTILQILFCYSLVGEMRSGNSAVPTDSVESITFNSWTRLVWFRWWSG